MASRNVAPLPTGQEPTEVLSNVELDEFAYALPPGSELGQYVIERIIGGGGCGIVYSARHHMLPQRVAIKVLRSEMAVFPAMVTRFVREAEAVNRIKHPNIVAIHEFGETEPGHPYYVMELLEGMDLRTLLQLHGRFSPREALSLLEPVMSAVQAAHEAGIIHRDIKANNVMIAEIQGQRAVKLLDFGIAKMLHGEASGQGLTEPGARIGTAHNMAPEQIRCERLDGRADIYALGTVLYQLLTGQYPFDAEDPRQIALMHLQAVPRPPSSVAPVPPALDAVVLRCLEKHAERRYASVSELLSAFRSAVGEAGSDLEAAPARALGVYFQASGGADEELDEAVFDDLSDVLDTCERTLSDASFSFPLRTSNALLAVRVIAGDPERERAEAEASLAELLSELKTRPSPHPSTSLAVSLSVGQVLHRKTTAGFEIVGGPLLEVGTWMEQTKLWTTGDHDR